MELDEQPGRWPRRVWPGILLAAGVGAAVVAFAIFSFFTRDVQEDEPRQRGKVWTAPVADGTRLYYLMEEKRSERGYFDTDAIHSFTLPYSIFTLHACNARDGAAPAVETVAIVGGGTADFSKRRVLIHLIDAPEILGAQGGVLWIWKDGLEARKLDSLAVVWTGAKLQELNPELGRFLPRERKYYKLLGSPNLLVFKGSDARYFGIDAATGGIAPLDEAALAHRSREHSKTADSAFASLGTDGESLWSTSPSGLMWSSMIDEPTATWYGLLTADEHASQYWSHPRYSMGPGGEVGRFLFRTSFTHEKSRVTTEDKIKLDVANVAKLGSERFLMGGFLRRPNADAIWIVGDGADAAGGAKGLSFLILHRQALGENSPWCITCIGADGAVRWLRSTGLAELEHLSDGRGAVVLTGYADRSQPTEKRPDLMVFIDEASGKSRTFNLITGASTAAP